MPYVTPPIYSSSNGYGFADVNRTNENVDYIKNQDATFNGIKNIFGDISSGGGSVRITSNKGSSSTEGAYGVLSFSKNDASFFGKGAEISGYGTFSDVSGLLFRTTAGGSASEKMRLEPSGVLNLHPSRTTSVSLEIRNDSYNQSSSSGSVGLAFGYLNHIGSKIQVEKITANTSKMDFYTELGFDTFTKVASFSTTGNELYRGIDITGSKSVIHPSVITDYSLEIRNDSYNQGSSTGTCSLGLGFLNHLGCKIEVEKITANTSRMNFYTELGFDTTVKVADMSTVGVNLLKPTTITGALTVDNVAQTSEWVTDATYARWGHKDFNLSSNYGILQQDTGDVYIAGPSIFMKGETNPTSAPTSGTWPINQTDTVVPRGQYNVRLSPGAGTSFISQDGGSFMISSQSRGGSFYSDGINTTYTTDASATILFWKF